VVPLLIQMLAVVTLALVVRAVLGRLGVRLDFVSTTALAVLLFLVQPAVVNMRTAWLRADKQREVNRSLDGRPEAAKAACLAVGIEGEFLSLVGSRIPVRERFYMDSDSLRGEGEFCVRFLLLPRVEVEKPEDARYIVFWDPDDRDRIDQARRQGFDVTLYSTTKAIAVRR
jgi:hypothetical protein